MSGRQDKPRSPINLSVIKFQPFTVTSSLETLFKLVVTDTRPFSIRVLEIARTCMFLSLFRSSFKVNCLASGFRSLSSFTSCIVAFPNQTRSTASVDDKVSSEIFEEKSIFRFIKQRYQYHSQDVAFSFSQVINSYQKIVR